MSAQPPPPKQPPVPSTTVPPNVVRPQAAPGTISSSTNNQVPGKRRASRVQDVREHHTNILLYGPPGVGKTVFASSGPEPVFFFDIDRGILSLRNIKREIYGEPISSLDDMIRWIKDIQAGFNQDPNYYRTIVVDNLTELQRVLINSLTKGGAIPEIRDWGIVLIQMQSLIKLIRELPCHKIWLAHEAMRRNEDSADTAAPSLSGKMSEELPGYFDIIMRYVIKTVTEKNPDGTEVTKTTRALLCNPTQTSMAKDRSAKLSKWEPIQDIKDGDMNKMNDLSRLIRKILSLSPEEAL